MIFKSLQNIIENLSIDFEPTIIPLDLDSEMLIKETRYSILIISNPRAGSYTSF